MYENAVLARCQTINHTKKAFKYIAFLIKCLQISEFSLFQYANFEKVRSQIKS